jgi:hypothetical protein
MMFPDFVAIGADIKSAASDLKTGHAASQATLESINATLLLILAEIRSMNAPAEPKELSNGHRNGKARPNGKPGF